MACTSAARRRSALLIFMLSLAGIPRPQLHGQVFHLLSLIESSILCSGLRLLYIVPGFIITSASRARWLKQPGEAPRAS